MISRRAMVASAVALATVSEASMSQTAQAALTPDLAPSGSRQAEGFGGTLEQGAAPAGLQVRADDPDQPRAMGPRGLVGSDRL